MCKEPFHVRILNAVGKHYIYAFTILDEGHFSQIEKNSCLAEYILSHNILNFETKHDLIFVGKQSAPYKIQFLAR